MELLLLEMSEFETGAQGGKREIPKIGEVEGRYDAHQKVPEGFMIPIPPEDGSQDYRQKIEAAIYDLKVFGQPWVHPPLDPDSGMHSPAEEVIHLDKQGIQVCGIYGVDQVMELSERQGNAEDLVPVTSLNPGETGGFIRLLNHRQDQPSPNQVSYWVKPGMLQPLMKNQHKDHHTSKIPQRYRVIRPNSHKRWFSALPEHTLTQTTIYRADEARARTKALRGLTLALDLACSMVILHYGFVITKG
jgi:hypothetical protein